MDTTILDSVRDRLTRKAYLYGDPSAFQAGVEAALAVVAQQQVGQAREIDLTEVLRAAN